MTQSDIHAELRAIHEELRLAHEEIAERRLTWPWYKTKDATKIFKAASRVFELASRIHKELVQ